MFFNILKRDLKRKVGMNIIIILFIIIATMFIAGSVNNIVMATTGLDSFFDRAGFTDGVAFAFGNVDDDITEKIDSCKTIKDYKYEKGSILNAKEIFINGDSEKYLNAPTLLLQTPGESEIKYFHEDGSVLTEVEKGKIYVTSAAMIQNELTEGDTLTVKLGNVSKEFEIAGVAKDAATGAQNAGITRLFISSEDYDYYRENSDLFDYSNLRGIYFSTDDYNETVSELSDAINCGLSTFDRTIMKFAYAVETISAGILFMASIILIVIAFVMIRFTIKFTISEEYREIGVMKAIGMTNSKIRSQYVVKYIIMTVVGALIGLILSFPFGNFLLKLGMSVIVVDNTNMSIINVVCALITALVTLLFSYSSTKNIKKMSPIDAIRSGQTGERSKKKTHLKLSKSKLGCTWFLALNDILSRKKQFGIIAVIFTLFPIIIFMVSTITNTFSGDGLFSSLGIINKTNAIINYDVDINSILMTDDGLDNSKEIIKEIEDKLEENGIPAKCVWEIMINSKLTYEDNSKSLTGLYGVGADMDMYECAEGTMPQNQNEIAISGKLAESLGIGIGDTVQIEADGKKTERIVTGMFDSMLNVGNVFRYYSGADESFESAAGNLGIEIIFTDNPGTEEINSRIEKIKELFPNSELLSREEFVEKYVNIADTLNAIKTALFAITVIMIILVVVLMEKTFILREKTQIALLKAQGFTRAFIYRWQILRFMIISVIALIAALILFFPISKLIADPIFKYAGVSGKIVYDIPVLEVFVIIPILLLVATFIPALLTAFSTRKISPMDTANVE